MWLVEMLLLSLVGGTILGVSWRLLDEWREKNGRDAATKAVIKVDSTNKQ
jgi:hypothetical protein